MVRLCIAGPPRYTGTPREIRQPAEPFPHPAVRSRGKKDEGAR